MHIDIHTYCYSQINSMHNRLYNTLYSPGNIAPSMLRHAKTSHPFFFLRSEPFRKNKSNHFMSTSRNV